MRIVSGTLRGRRINPPLKNWPTRPTTDFAREALFNILTNQFDFEDINALDLFGGTGVHSIELISRGCKNVIYIDKHKGCTRFVKDLSKQLEIDNYLTIIQSDIFKFLRNNSTTFNYIFADPPYDFPFMEKLIKLVTKGNILNENGLFAIEHRSSNDLSGYDKFIFRRNYGGCAFSFFLNQ